MYHLSCHPQYTTGPSRYLSIILVPGPGGRCCGCGTWAGLSEIPDLEPDLACGCPVKWPRHCCGADMHAPGQTWDLHGHCSILQGTHAGAQAMGHGHAWTQRTNAKAGVRGRLGSRNFVWLGPELVNMGKEGLSSSGRVPLLSSDPSLPTLQGSRFLLRSSSPRRRGGAGAQQGEGLYSRRYRQGVKAGKGVTGVLGAEKARKRSHNVRRGPGCHMTSLLPAVSDMEEPRYGELCCPGKADGEEWSVIGGKARTAFR